MPTYLNSPFKDKERVKALGGRWDPERRQWYVPDGRDLAEFAQWLPAEAAADMAPGQAAVGAYSLEVATTRLTAMTALLPLGDDGGLALPAPASGGSVTRGITLSQLLQGVERLVTQSYRAGVWTIVDVTDVRRTAGGHLRLELADRDADGAVTAQANALIWRSDAQGIVGAFQAATGVELAPGIKLLVRARPTLSALYGFSLQIDAIDPDYTLGDLEARKREIRSRLQAEGLFEANRQLPRPWDYQSVLVVSPQQAAGLGDFQADSQWLERFGVCRFRYVHCRFQGPGAAAEILEVADRAVRRSLAEEGGGALDAVVIVRGGGPVNDLAWLNDHALARWVCELPIPVHTGIGHERDSTILDEVANIAFDTPSKAIKGIEAVIAARAAEARTNFERIAATAGLLTTAATLQVNRLHHDVRELSNREVTTARRDGERLFSGVRESARKAIRAADRESHDRLHAVRQAAVQQLGAARAQLPRAIAAVRAESSRLLRDASGDSRRALRDVEDGARRATGAARTGAQALMREIVAQGPQKTLARGFAVVRADGKALTSAEDLRAAGAGQRIAVEMHDGQVDVHVGPPANEPGANT